MITYRVRQAWIDHARARAEDYGRGINGEGRDAFIGTLGELAFGRLLTDQGIPFTYTGNTSTTWDFEVDGRRIDVKTQRDMSGGVPRPDYRGIIMETQANHECDMYVFAILDWDRMGEPRRVFLISAINKTLFHNHPNLLRAREGENIEHMTVYQDCSLLRYRHMASINTLIKLFHERC